MAARCQLDVPMPLPFLRRPLERLFASRLPKHLARLDGRLKGADIHPGQRVLYLGCGQGELLGPLRDLVGPTGEVISVEARPRLRARAEGHGQEILAKDSSNTELPEGAFDRVILHRVFHTLRDRSGTVREIHRVLKPGGKLWLWEPRIMLRSWQIQAYEGMFRGARLDNEWSHDGALGFARRYVAASGLPGSRL